MFWKKCPDFIKDFSPDFLGARMKTDISRREDEERRISALLRFVHGQYTAKYVLDCSSFMRRDTFFFRSASVIYHCAKKKIIFSALIEDLLPFDWLKYCLCF